MTQEELVAAVAAQVLALQAKAQPAQPVAATVPSWAPAVTTTARKVRGPAKVKVAQPATDTPHLITYRVVPAEAYGVPGFKVVKLHGPEMSPDRRRPDGKFITQAEAAALLKALGGSR